MSKLKKIGDGFQKGLEKLGFERNDDSLFLIDEFKKAKDYKKLDEPQIAFHIEKARDFNATAVYLRKQLNGSYKPQVYLYDYTGSGFQEESVLTEVQKKIWSSGEVPLVCVFYDTEIKIIDCTTHITTEDTPVYIFNSLDVTSKAKNLYDKEFAVKIKSGVFWEEEENKNKFEFINSSYDRLIENIRIVVKGLKQKYKKLSSVFINKIIIQSILIKYLEERIDNNGRKLLSDKFFKKYKANTFNDVLRNGKFIELLDDLNDPKEGFNGNVFEWSEEHKQILKGLKLSVLADLLDTKKVYLESPQFDIEFPDWRYFEFRYIPVELISRLYEEFLASTDDPDTTQEEKKKKEGTFYTPSHLVKLLVDEVLPLKKYREVDLDNYHILDPSCGSGIFLVTVFKRLVQIWRLKNNMDFPDKDDLKKILKNIYGIDKDEQAVQLASFSLCLALCNELEPLEIIQKLKFDDLSKTNIIHSDFFVNHKLSNKKFNLIIGNPPFVRGGAKGYKEEISIIDNIRISIPSKQLALKFLIDSYSYLKPKGLQCLIVKSSSLLYNSTSNKLKEQIFSKLNVLQILDFTALARNNSLWDGADVATAAMFIRKEAIDFTKNILHLTFHKTKATKERIVFEIDDYDLHFINRTTAIENPFIWKINLLGGGRIKSIIDKFQNFKTLKEYLSINNCVSQEGHGTLTSKSPYPTKINKRLESHSGIVDNQINFDKTNIIPAEEREKIRDLLIYHYPSIIISETIDIQECKLNLALNKKEDLVFRNRFVGIATKTGDLELLKSIYHNFIKHNKLYILQLFVKSAQAFINRNTAILAYDLYNLRFITEKIISNYDKNISNDVIEYFQEYLRLGENSKAVKPICKNEIEHCLSHYGNEFSNTLNLIYKDKKKKFRLSDVVTLSNSFIAAIFKYDDKTKTVKIHNDISNLEPGIIKELSNHKISERLSVNRIIKLYPGKDTIVFIKPNQYRYWLSLIAYRDADKCFVDFSHFGF